MTNNDLPIKEQCKQVQNLLFETSKQIINEIKQTFGSLPCSMKAGGYYKNRRPSFKHNSFHNYLHQQQNFKRLNHFNNCKFKKKVQCFMTKQF